MTPQEFKSEMTAFEASLVVSEAQRAERDIRWKEYYRKLRQYSAEEFRSARDELVAVQKFLPALSEVLQACEEARQSLTPKSEPQRKFKPRYHRCSSEKPLPSEALQSLGALSRYEAQHICCPGELMATCPQCGAGHNETSILSGLAARDPQACANWNPHWKGLMLCPDCEARG